MCSWEENHLWTVKPPSPLSCIAPHILITTHHKQQLSSGPLGMNNDMQQKSYHTLRPNGLPNNHLRTLLMIAVYETVICPFYTHHSPVIISQWGHERPIQCEDCNVSTLPFKTLGSLRNVLVLKEKHIFWSIKITIVRNTL